MEEWKKQSYSIFGSDSTNSTNGSDSTTGGGAKSGESVDGDDNLSKLKAVTSEGSETAVKVPRAKSAKKRKTTAGNKKTGAKRKTPASTSDDGDEPSEDESEGFEKAVTVSHKKSEKPRKKTAVTGDDSDEANDDKGAESSEETDADDYWLVNDGSSHQRKRKRSSRSSVNEDVLAKLISSKDVMIQRMAFDTVSNASSEGFIKKLAISVKKHPTVDHGIDERFEQMRKDLRVVQEECEAGRNQTLAAVREILNDVRDEIIQSAMYSTDDQDTIESRFFRMLLVLHLDEYHLQFLEKKYYPELAPLFENIVSLCHKKKLGTQFEQQRQIAARFIKARRDRWRKMRLKLR